MAAGVFDRRRAERFAQLLDQAEGRGHRHSREAIDEELAGYVALGRSIAASDPAVEERPDPDFRSSLRAMLVATAEREGIGAAANKDRDKHRVSPDAVRTAVVGPIYLSAAAQVGTTGTVAKRRPVVGSRRTRGAIIVGIIAGTLALSGMSMASGDAMPGDPLYGVKRSTESAQLALAGSDIDRGQTYLGFARNRSREATTLQDDPTRLTSALTDMDNEETQGVRLLTTVALVEHNSTALDIIDDFVTAQRQAIVDLLPGLSGAQRSRAERSVSLIDQIGKRTADLRAALSCGPATAGSDALGPLPPPCPGASRAGQTGPNAGH